MCTSGGRAPTLIQALRPQKPSPGNAAPAGNSGALAAGAARPAGGSGCRTAGEPRQTQVWRLAMALLPDPRWVSCPECGGAARREPGSVRCIVGGHLMTLRSVLPKLTASSDWRNRLRMRAIDEAFRSPFRGGEIPIRLLEKLEEGLHKP